MQPARLLMPALRWDERSGFAHEAERIDAALSLGVGGFVLFGGEVEAVRELTASLRARCAHALLLASDLERGAGQQFRGATQLPPLAALGALDDLAATRQAAALTAREANALGINWILAPVADLDLEPRNPIIGTRAFGPDPLRVSAHVSAWIEGCRSEGLLCCVKHFPGHGRTTEDSHERLPRVSASRTALDVDLTPFRAAVLAGADAVMTAHVAFPALDAADRPATLSPAIIENLLRTDLGFEGLVATDAFNMGGVQVAEGEPAAAVAAIAAGCDVICYPSDAAATAAALDRALGHILPRPRVARAIGRVNSAAARSSVAEDASVGRPHDQAWALGLAVRCIGTTRGDVDCDRVFDLITIDDDLGGPFPAPSRKPLLTALQANGFEPHAQDHDHARTALIALYADIRAWKGRPGLSQRAREQLAAALGARPDTPVLLFGHPRLAAETTAQTVVCAWGGEAIMQRAAARWLADATMPPSAA